MPHVTALVQQMQDTLAQIHDTISLLDTKSHAHDEQLDALEDKRDSLFERLQAAFHQQSEELGRKRRAKRDEIAEQRRREDEEIAARRRSEDAELQCRDQSQDTERERRLEAEKQSVFEETENQMEEVELEAERMLDEGQKKMAELEQKRQEIHRMIDEQMKAPLPSPPKRRRGMRSALAPKTLSAPAEAAPPQPPSGEREASPQDLDVAVKPSEKEIVSEKDSVEKATAPVPDKPSGVDAIPSVSHAGEATREVQAEEAEPGPNTMGDALPQNDKDQKNDTQNPRAVSEEHIENSDSQPGLRNQSPRELAPETKSVTEPSKEDVIREAPGRREPTSLQTDDQEERVVVPSHQPTSEARDSRGAAADSANQSPGEYSIKTDQPESKSLTQVDEGEKTKTTDPQHGPEQEGKSQNMLLDSGDVTDLEKNLPEDRSGRSIPNAVDHQIGSQDATGTEIESKSVGTVDGQMSSMAEDAAGSKQDSVESSKAHVGSSHVDEAEQTCVSPKQPGASMETASGDHSVNAVGGSAVQANLPQPRSAGEKSSVPDQWSGITHEEHSSNEDGLSLEGIAKGGEAEEYLHMARTKPGSNEDLPQGISLESGEYASGTRDISQSVDDELSQLALGEQSIPHGTMDDSSFSEGEGSRPEADNGSTGQPQSTGQANSTDLVKGSAFTSESGDTPSETDLKSGPSAEESATSHQQAQDAREGSADATNDSQSSSSSIAGDQDTESASWEDERISSPDRRFQPDTIPLPKSDECHRVLQAENKDGSTGEIQDASYPDVESKSGASVSAPAKGDTEQHPVDQTSALRHEEIDCGDKQRKSEHDAGHLSESHLDQPSSPSPEEETGAQGKNDGQVFEGSGNDLLPFRRSETNDSGDRQADETFDASGNEPIAGTMTLGKDPVDEKNRLGQATHLPAGSSDDAQPGGGDSEPGAQDSGVAALEKANAAPSGGLYGVSDIDIGSVHNEPAHAAQGVESKQGDKSHSRESQVDPALMKLPDSPILLPQNSVAASDEGHGSLDKLHDEESVQTSGEIPIEEHNISAGVVAEGGETGTPVSANDLDNTSGPAHGDTQPSVDVDAAAQEPSTLVTGDAREGDIVVPSTSGHEDDVSRPERLRSSSPSRAGEDGSAHYASASNPSHVEKSGAGAFSRDLAVQGDAHAVTVRSNDRVSGSQSPSPEEQAAPAKPGPVITGSAGQGDASVDSNITVGADASNIGVTQVTSPPVVLDDKACCTTDDDDGTSSRSVEESIHIDSGNKFQDTNVNENNPTRDGSLEYSQVMPQTSVDPDDLEAEDHTTGDGHIESGSPPGSVMRLEQPPHETSMGTFRELTSPTRPLQQQSKDGGATKSSQKDQPTSPSQHSVSRLEGDSSYSESGADVSSEDDLSESDRAGTPRPTTASVFGSVPHDKGAPEATFFEHVPVNIPAESAHTNQGTDDLFDDDSSSSEFDDDPSDYGSAVIEQPERLVYTASGSDENLAVGGNRSSWGPHSAGSRSSHSSVRETTAIRPTEGIYLATSPNVVRADWAGEWEDEIRPTSRGTPRQQTFTSQDSPAVGPFALRNAPRGKSSDGADDFRGQVASPWSAQAETPTYAPHSASHSPITPSSATRYDGNNPFRLQQRPRRFEEPDVDSESYMPRDVTNTPWHARNDSVPASLHSQTTFSSHQSSPTHSSFAADIHEPVIRDSWTAPAPGYQHHLSGFGGRPRANSSLSNNSSNNNNNNNNNNINDDADYDPFKADLGAAANMGSVNKKGSIYNPYQQRTRAESAASASASPARTSGLFSKMRSVFEQSGSRPGDAPPGLSPRPVSSSTYHSGKPPPSRDSAWRNRAGSSPEE